jgi:DNA polymerase-3 subunit gamma/tau
VPQMAEAVDADDPEAAETARLAAAMPADETQLLYSLCLHGRGELGLAPDEYAALTMVLLRLLAFKPQGEPAEKKTLKRPEGGLSAPAAGQGLRPQVAASAPPAVPAAVAAPAPAPAAREERMPDAPDAPGQGHAPAAGTDGDEPPPWPGSDEDAGPAAAVQAAPPRTPTVTALPVRSGEKFEENQAPGQSAQARQAPEFVAIPVREAPEPGARLQPLPLSAPAPVAARYTPTEEGDVWHATVQQLVAAEAITALVRELALQSQLVARDGGHWLLRVERESLNQPTARERLRAALEAAGHATQISVEVGVVIDSPARRNAAAAAERQRRAEEIVQNDPYVQSLVRDYGAKIVPGSIKPA